MSTLKVTIELGNEVMQSRVDISDALHEAAARHRQYGEDYFPIMDRNGNKVGEFLIETD